MAWEIKPSTKVVTKAGDLTQKVTLNTAGTFVDRNIEVTTTTNVPASTVTVNDGVVEYSAGWIDAGTQDVAAGTLNNQATAGLTYTENQAANTILPSEGALYINAGYFGNTKITLKHMIPDDTNYDNAGVAHIRSGYEAFDVNGKKLVGTMADVSPTFTGGAVTATASGEVKTKPVVTVAAGGTMATSTSYGITKTKPTGTGQADGTTYLSIDGSGTVTKGAVTAKADASRTAVTYSKAATGYINKSSGTTASSAANATQNTTDVEVDVTVTDNFAPIYVPIVSSGTLSGGTVSATADGEVKRRGSVTPSVSGSCISNTNLVTSDKSEVSGTDGTDYWSITPGASATASTVTAKADASRTAITLTNSAGLVSANMTVSGTPTSSASATQNTKDVDVTASVGSGTTYYLKKATATPGLATHTVDKPKITNNTVVASSNTEYLTTGITTTAPSSGEYITINASASTTNGTSHAKPNVTTTSGGIIGSTIAAASNDDKTIGVDVTAGTKQYIKFYSGSYTA